MIIKADVSFVEMKFDFTRSSLVKTPSSFYFHASAVLEQRSKPSEDSGFFSSFLLPLLFLFSFVLELREFHLGGKYFVVANFKFS